MDVPAAIAARVSRETALRLAIFVSELSRWQAALNLVSANSMRDIWSRHVDDCLQVAELAADAPRWLDIGSGGGLPGLVVAASDAARPVALIESDARKCAFLRSTAHRMGVQVTVHNVRIEDYAADGETAPPFGVISARAVAPLTRLLAYAQPFMRAGAIGLFPKGRTAIAELTEARESWTFDADVVPSRTDPEGRILRIRELAGPRT